MTISRWLRIKADEEIREIAMAEGRAKGYALGLALGRAEGRGIAKGRAEGYALGIAETDRAWEEWLRRMQDAQRDGKPFDEPPPSSR